MSVRKLLAIGILVALAASSVEVIPAENLPAADLVVKNAKIVTVDKDFTIAQSLAVTDDRVVAVGSDAAIAPRIGPKTKVIDAGGKTILPGLYDTHTHPVGAATSELDDEIPYLTGLDDVYAYIRKKAETTKEGHWIVLRFAFPTRLKEARFPTIAELDAAAPKHPVLYNAGPACMVNSMALKVSGITRDTPNPAHGTIVRDKATGEPTGMLRNAEGLLKGVPGGKESTEDRRAAVKKLFRMYNEHGITSVADRAADRGNVDLYHALHKAGELTVRVNVARRFGPSGTREEIAKRLDELPGKDKLGGPTGVGGVWIRIGPIKFFLDGGMLNGTAYMRQPWPPGPTYQITEDDYRGLLFAGKDQVQALCDEAAKRGWSVTAHTAGEGAMDVLLDAYDVTNRITPIRDLRFCITHANFPSQRNLERCKELGVVADVQPAWLYKDGDTLLKVLGPERMRWFQPYKSWLKYTTIGGGSDHMIKLDPRKATNPWDPWLALEVVLTRKLASGQVHQPAEALNREEALRLYTTGSAYINREEKEKGSLEPGKLADFIVLDRDYLTCPAEEVSRIQVLRTIVGGKTVYER